MLEKIAKRLGCTIGQLCLAWALRRHVAVVTKTEKEWRMKENLGATEVAGRLTADDIASIDALNINERKFLDFYEVP